MDIIVASSSEKVHLSLRKMCRFRSRCACVKHHPGLRFINVRCNIQCFCQQTVKALIRLCANAQADLDIRYPHMPEGTGPYE